MQYYIKEIIILRDESIVDLSQVEVGSGCLTPQQNPDKKSLMFW